MDGSTRHPTVVKGRAVTFAVCGFVAVAAFLLWTEHRAHLLGVLPYLLLLACPVFDLLMHRGQGHGQHQDHLHGRQDRAGDQPAGGGR
jgi:hypothetical protein